MDIVKWVFSLYFLDDAVRAASRRALIHPFVNWVTSIATIEIIRRVIDLAEIGDLWSADMYVWSFVWFVFLWWISRYITRYWWFGELWPKCLSYLYTTYLDTFVKLDNNSVESLGTGRSMHIIEKGIWSWIMMYTDMLIKLSSYAIKVTFSVALIFTFSIWYWFFFFGIVALIVWLYVVSQMKANEARRERKVLWVGQSRDMIRIIMSKFEVLQNGKIIDEIKKQKKIFIDWYGINKKIDLQKLISEWGAMILIEGVRILALVSLLYWFILGSLTLSGFVTITIIATMLDEITWNFSRLYIDLSKEYISVEKMWHMFDGIDEIEWYEDGSDFAYKTWSIELKQVTYGYGEFWVFENFNLSLEWGKRTALVWVSWSWKSTLAKLISWYLHPDEGDVIVDGQALSTVSLKSYYGQVGYLTQEPSVFDGTVYDNLTYALTVEELQDGWLEERIKNAIISAKCEFLYDLERWLQTEIWERWVRLSGGQKQRLAIAKIFLKNPKILILDEPTSALDSFSEEAITEAMHALFVWRTVIIIAHRLQTVKEADEIILLDEGKISERGTHDILLEKWWAYAKMLRLQSGF